MKPIAVIRALNFDSVTTGKTHKQSFQGAELNIGLPKFTGNIGLTAEFKTLMDQIFLEVGSFFW